MFFRYPVPNPEYGARYNPGLFPCPVFFRRNLLLLQARHSQTNKLLCYPDYRLSIYVYWRGEYPLPPEWLQQHLWPARREDILFHFHLY